MARKLTYDFCKEVASKFNHIHELQLEDASVYGKIRDNKWFELLSHMTKPENKNIIWTYERCKEEVLKYTYYNDLQGTTLLNVLRKNGWIDELTSHLIRQLRNDYTIEEIHQEALKYERRVDFQKKSNAEYLYARRRGILDEVCQHMGKPKNIKQYTKEEILESAKKYNNQRDWHNNEVSIYRCAAGYNKKKTSEGDKQFWKSCIEHMEFIFKPNGHWTYERCKEEALKYDNYKDFRENSHAYNVIKKNDWWDELCGHITSNRKRNGYWTYETCKETALKYTDRGELSKNEGACYGIIKENGWDELLSHIEYKTTLFQRYIYAFEFPDNHVYIGLTHNLNKRKSDHLTSNKSISPVRKHMEETGLDFVFKSVFENPFPKEIAGEMEGIVLNDYVSKGWIPLNRTKTGGLGGSQVIWTYDKIKSDLVGVETISGARKKLSYAVFGIIKKFGWGDLLSSLIDDSGRVNWTIETATEELKKYSRRTDIQANQNGLYKFARKNDLLRLVPKSKPLPKNPLKDKYTKGEVYEMCLSYGTSEEIKQNNREYYTCAKNNGWWDDIIKQLKDKRGIKSKYSYEDCLNIALKYNTKDDLTKDWSGVVKTIKKNGWWEEMTKHMKRKTNETYTMEQVIEICKGYRNRSSLEKEKSGVFKYVQRHNLMDELFPIKNKPPGYWNEKNCLIEALKYENRKDFRKGSAGAYGAAMENKWLDEICSHMSKRLLSEEEKETRDLKIIGKIKEGYTYKQIREMFKVHQRVIQKLRNHIYEQL